MGSEAVADNHSRSAYRRILAALDEAIFLLQRAADGDGDDLDDWEQGTFHLGEAGGIAFSAHCPGAGCGALFEEISDAVAEEELDRVRQLRSLLEARLRSPDAAPPGGGALDGGALVWDSGYLQLLAVLQEARRARDAGNAYRYWVMAGFLAGFLRWDAHSGPAQNGLAQPGTLRDEVISACGDGWGETLWQEWEEIRDEWLAGGGGAVENSPPPEAPGRDLLFRWMGLRLAAADRLTGVFGSPPSATDHPPTGDNGPADLGEPASDGFERNGPESGGFERGGPSATGATHDEPVGSVAAAGWLAAFGPGGDAEESACFMRCERSTRRAQNFGRRTDAP